MKRLSVIIPMYNVEDYVERCIRSLENQDIPETDYEIICINDGSPDNCHGIIRELQKEFSNIVLIDQENQGVSIARNNGISIATGRYLLMIDPDDYVLEQSLNAVLTEADKLDLDALYLGFEILLPDGNKVWQTDFARHRKKVYDGIEGYFADRTKDARDPDHSWAILFRSELINSKGLSYPKGVPYLEDGLFLVKVFSVASRVGFLDLIFYRRTIRYGSATNSDLFYSQRAIAGFIMAVRDLSVFSKRFKFNLKQKGLINHGIADFVLLSLFPLIRLKSIGYFLRTCNILKYEGYGTLDTYGVVEPYLTYAKQYNLSPLCFAISYGKDLLLKKVQMSLDKINHYRDGRSHF